MRNKRLLSLLISASLIVGQMGLTGVYAAETKGDEVVTFEEDGFEKPAEVAEDDEKVAASEEETEDSTPEAEDDNANDPDAVTEYAPLPTAMDLADKTIKLMADPEAGEEVKKADIAFIIDTTGSMSGAIKSVSMNLSYFIDALEDKKVDLHISLIDYKDIYEDAAGLDTTVIHKYPSGDVVWGDEYGTKRGKKNKYTVSEGNIWTVSGGDVKEDLAWLSNNVTGGGDGPETPTDALQKLLSDDYGWREGTNKFAFLLTDAGCKSEAEKNDRNYKTLSGNVLPNINEIAGRLRKAGIKTTVVSSRSYESEYNNLFTLTGGKFINIYDTNWYKIMIKIAGWVYSASSDTDGDGLMDEWEKNGIDVDGVHVDLPGMGADPEVPDVFVEVDYFEDKDKGIAFKPDAAALRMVYQSFKDHGVNLHIDAGPDSVDYVTGKTWGDKSGGNSIERDFNQTFELGSRYSNWNRLAVENFESSRWNTFRYCIFMNDWRYGSVNGTSGIAEDLPGQFFIVSDSGHVSGNKLVGGLTDLGSTAIAGTFMHELGHTLGLSHGGIDSAASVADHTQYKPNYLSVMNYLFQFSGLVGTNELNYSEYALPALDETALVEKDGFDPEGRTAAKKLGTKWYDAMAGGFVAVENIAGTAVDFNGDGDTDDTVATDINKDSATGVITKTESDWDNIIYLGGLVGGLGEEVDDAKRSTLLTRKASVADKLENEITLDEAKALKLDINPGTCTVGAVLPSKAFKGLNGQSISVNLKSIKDEDATVKLKVQSDLIEGGVKEQNVALKAKAEVSATVDLLSDISVGSHAVTIVATDAEGREAIKTTTVTVEEPKAIDIDFGAEFDLSTISFNSTVSPDSFTWKSLDEKIATVNGKKAKGEKPGEVGLIAYVADDAIGAVKANVGGNLVGTHFTAGKATYDVYVTKEVSANGKAKHFEKGRGSNTKRKLYDVDVLVFRDGQLLAQTAYKTKFKKNKKAGTATVTLKLAKSVGDKAEKKVVKKQKFTFTIK